MKKKSLLYVLFAVLTVVFVSCSRNKAVSQTPAEFIPAAPDYTDSEMWFTKNGDTAGTGADVFYVVSTWEEDWWAEGGKICHYADVWNPIHRAHMENEISRISDFMSPGNRFYSPFYRHITIDGWITGSEELIQSRARLAMEDVCVAMHYPEVQYVLIKNMAGQ